VSYPYGPAVTPTLADLPTTVIQRRQGDVKATLIPITLNNTPVNISGWTFIFSVTLPTGVSDVMWTVSAPTSSTPITTVAGSGFSVPGFNSTVSMDVVSTAQITAGDQIFIDGAGVYTVDLVTSPTSALIINAGLSGNLSSGLIGPGANVFAIGQIGMTVLVIPDSITSVAPGMYPAFCKYITSDPPPGPYTNTFLQGVLQILTQNDA
jgi:hypothetical protein